MTNFCLGFLSSRSSDAICQTFDLQLDDIVILSTDGLFDNVPDRLIEFILANVSFHRFDEFFFLNDVFIFFSLILESIVATCSTTFGHSSCSILCETR